MDAAGLSWKRNRRAALTTALRMVLYPVLGMAFFAAVFIHPRGQELYFYVRWQQVTEEAARDRYFTELRLTHPARDRMEKYWAERARQLIPAHFGEGKKCGYWKDNQKTKVIEWQWGPLRPAIQNGYGTAIVPALITALADKDRDVRVKAVMALSEVDKKAVPALITALTDKDRYVRYGAARALGVIGEKSAMSALITALTDKDKGTRFCAVMALGRIADKAAVPALIIALADKEDVVRSYVANTLGWLGDEEAVPALITALADNDESFRSDAAEALGRIGDKAAMPALITALADKDKTVRKNAAGALGGLGEKAAVPALITALADKDEIVRYSAAWALGRIGKKAVSALPALRRVAAADKAKNVCNAATSAIAAIEDAQK